ncbi:hypothetical protein RTP6_001930 [Batrachochytrium dendrobatidis]
MSRRHMDDTERYINHDSKNSHDHSLKRKPLSRSKMLIVYIAGFLILASTGVLGYLYFGTHVFSSTAPANQSNSELPVSTNRMQVSPSAIADAHWSKTIVTVGDGKTFPKQGDAVSVHCKILPYFYS